jgi:PhnB protein
VENADSLFNRAITAGGRVHGAMGALADQFWGDRAGTLIDPFGYQWTIATHKEDLTPQEMEQRRAAWMKTTA